MAGKAVLPLRGRSGSTSYRIPGSCPDAFAGRERPNPNSSGFRTWARIGSTYRPRIQPEGPLRHRSKAMPRAAESCVCSWRPHAMPKARCVPAGSRAEAAAERCRFRATGGEQCRVCATPSMSRPPAHREAPDRRPRAMRSRGDRCRSSSYVRVQNQWITHVCRHSTVRRSRRAPRWTPNGGWFLSCSRAPNGAPAPHALRPSTVQWACRAW